MAIPTLSELFNDVLGDLEAEFNITIPLFGKNFLRALAAVKAAKLKLVYLTIASVLYLLGIFVYIIIPVFKTIEIIIV